jgi:hypothetical protein
VGIDLGLLSGSKIKVWWYDPRDGGANPAGERVAKGIQDFTPPAPTKPGDINDWVLVLDDASRQFATPGKGSAPTGDR